MNLKKVNTQILISVLLFITVLTGAAWASNTVMFEDYQIRIFSDPDPLIAGQEATITIKILRSRDNTPVRSGKIFLSTKDTLQTININGFNFTDTADFVAANEADEFGNYALKTTFGEPDTYYIKIAIKELEGKIINDPLRAGFTINVQPPDNSTLRLLFILFTILLMTVIGLYLVNVRKNIKSGFCGPNTFNRLFKYRCWAFYHSL
jgi:hypothetical protein